MVVSEAPNLGIGKLYIRQAGLIGEEGTKGAPSSTDAAFSEPVRL